MRLQISSLKFPEKLSLKFAFNHLFHTIESIAVKVTAAVGYRYEDILEVLVLSLLIKASLYVRENQLAEKLKWPAEINFCPTTCRFWKLLSCLHPRRFRLWHPHYLSSFAWKRQRGSYAFDMYTIHAVIPKCVLETQKLVNVIDICFSFIMTLQMWQP